MEKANLQIVVEDHQDDAIPNELTSDNLNLSNVDTESETAFVDASLEFWISKNIRTGSMLVFWFLKSKALRLTSIALHKWARSIRSIEKYDVSRPRSIPGSAVSLKKAFKKGEENTAAAFAETVHDAILDGKRNLLLSLARDIISGAGLTTNSLSLLDHSAALEDLEKFSMSTSPNRRGSSRVLRLEDAKVSPISPPTGSGIRNAAFSPRAAVNPEKIHQLQQARPHSMQYQRVKLIRQMRSTSAPQTSKNGMKDNLHFVFPSKASGNSESKVNRRRSTKFEKIPSSGYGNWGNDKQVSPYAGMHQSAASLDEVLGRHGLTSTGSGVTSKPPYVHDKSKTEPTKKILKNSAAVYKTKQSFPLRKKNAPLKSPVDKVDNQTKEYDPVSNRESTASELSEGGMIKTNVIIVPKKPAGMTKAQWNLLQGVNATIPVASKPYEFVKR